MMHSLLIRLNFREIYIKNIINESLNNIVNFDPITHDFTKIPILLGNFVQIVIIFHTNVKFLTIFNIIFNQIMGKSGKFNLISICMFI